MRRTNAIRFGKVREMRKKSNKNSHVVKLERHEVSKKKKKEEGEREKKIENSPVRKTTIEIGAKWRICTALGVPRYF